MAATVKVITKPPRTLADQAYVPAIAQGLRLTMGRFFKNTFSSREEGEIVTLMYPEETEAYPERFRGIHRLTRGPRVINAEVKAEMKKILGEIQSGEFAREFVGEVQSGGARFNELREQGKAHQIEQVGGQLRSMMPWISAGKVKVEDVSGGD